MTEFGQTDNYSVADHIKAIIEHCGEGLIDYCIYDTGEVRIPVTNEIYNTILDYVSGDKDLSLVVDEDSQTAYFGFKSVMKNFSITKDDKIPDNEINLEI